MKKVSLLSGVLKSIWDGSMQTNVQASVLNKVWANTHIAAHSARDVVRRIISDGLRPGSR